MSGTTMGLVGALEHAGIGLVATLPDSWLTEFINELDACPRVRHVRVAREDDGMGVCAGAYLGGMSAALVCQNGGLLASINALAGYTWYHRIPFLVVATERGGPDDAFPYHAYKGRVTRPVLDAVGVSYQVVDSPGGFGAVVIAAERARAIQAPVVLLLTRSAFVHTEG